MLQQNQIDELNKILEEFSIKNKLTLNDGVAFFCSALINLMRNHLRSEKEFSDICDNMKEIYRKKNE